MYIFGTKHELLSGTLNLWDKYLGNSKNTSKLNANQSGMDDENAISSTDVPLEVSDRDYLGNTSKWLGNAKPSHYAVQAMPAESISFKRLQTDVFKHTQSKVVSVGNKLVMVYVEDDKDRDEYNRMRLMSTVYNQSDDTWSTPVAVNDNGYNDL